MDRVTKVEELTALERERICSQLQCNGRCYLSSHLSCEDRDNSGWCKKAERVLVEGYGNMKEAVKEFAEKLKAELNNAYVNATTPFQAGKNAGLDVALMFIDELIPEDPI